MKTHLLFFLFLIALGLNAQKTVVFNPVGGVYLGLEEVTLDIPEGFKVYFTNDGTLPSRANNSVKEILRIHGNTVFRFLIYDDKGKKSYVSQSYFTKRKHTLPIVSITIDTIDFSDSIHGIYVKGCCADSIDPYRGANFWKDWEKPIHIEIIEKNNTQVINQQAGIKIFGGYSVSMPQKSFAIYARKKYGDNRFSHQLHPNRPFDKYKNFILRNAGGDMQMAHIRDVYATQLVKETGLAIQEYQPVSVYINGDYWGKYNLREKINEHYIKSHFGYDKDSIIIMRHRIEPQHGSTRDYEVFIAKVPSLDLTKKEDLRYMDSKMDIQNYILYNICEIYTGNKDAGGNIRYYKHVSDTAKWRWIFYDLDMGLNYDGIDGYKINSITDFTKLKVEIWPNPPWSTLIIRKILENDSLKQLYINQFSDLLNISFQDKRALGLIDSLKDEVSDEILYHLDRWGIPKKRYDYSFKKLRVFAEKRPIVLRSFLRERFDLSDDLFVKIIVPKGGKVKFNTLTIKDTFEGVYYKNIPLKIEAITKFDYDFKGWKNLSNIDKRDYLSFNRDTLVLEPVFKKRVKSKFAGKVFITEVDATQAKKDTFNDWIEIYNASDKTIDLSNWGLKDDEDEHRFTFPKGTIIAPDAFIIISEDTLALSTYFFNKALIIGNLNFGIHKKSDKIRLYDDGNKIVDELNLKKLDGTEKDQLNWTKIDFRLQKFNKSNWIQEKASPGSKSSAFKKLLKYEEDSKRWKLVFFYSGISLGALVVLLFLFSLFRREK